MNAPLLARNTEAWRRTEPKEDQGTLTDQDLKDQNRRFQGTAGISQENGPRGFLPPFLDTHTGTVYLSRFSDGRIAPMHLLGGLPPELVSKQAVSEKVTAANSPVIAGFMHRGRFYTRRQAARAAMEC